MYITQVTVAQLEKFKNGVINPFSQKCNSLIIFDLTFCILIKLDDLLRELGCATVARPKSHAESCFGKSLLD